MLKKIIITLLAIGLLILLVSKIQDRIQSPVRHAILQQVKQCEKNKDFCLINIRDFTDFDWDKMYFFQDSSRDKESLKSAGIKNVEGSEFKECFYEFRNSFFFTKEDKIVYCEFEILDSNSIDAYANLNISGAYDGVGQGSVLKVEEAIESRYYLSPTTKNEQKNL